MTVPAPYLNHAYRVVDTATYQAVRDDPWVGDAFAPREERTTNRPDWSYTGVYLYGRTSYLEFFDERASQGPIGATGIAVGVADGQTSAIADAWRTTLTMVRTALVERPMENGGVPWFWLATATPDRTAGLHLWSMEYHASFLARWHADLTPAGAHGPGDVLDRYAARVTAQPRAGYLLDDVARLELALAPDALRFLDAHLAPLGVVSGRTPALVARLGGTEIVAASSEAPAGITAVTCTLRRDVPREERRVGASHLRLEARTARWTFGT